MHQVQVGGLPYKYEMIGSGPLLVLLHGWANTWEAWLPLIPKLSDHYTLILPDLPGFGTNHDYEGGWTTLQYAQWLADFLKKIMTDHENQPLYLGGHSFGGKIAAFYCASGLTPTIERLILIDASGIPGKLSARQQLLQIASRLLPKRLKLKLSTRAKEKIYHALGAESDYLYANPLQQNTLSKILSEDITPILERIQTPTLLLWGTKNKFPPLSHGEIFHGKLKTSTLLTYTSGHFPHHEYPDQVAQDILSFLNQPKRKFSPFASNRQITLATKLAILQQAEYEWPRFKSWLTHQNRPSTVEPKKWTPKLRSLLFLTKVFTPIFGENAALHFWLRVLTIPQFLLFNFIFLLAAIKLRLLQKNGLIVVAIAGSYAKTSTKFILHHVLARDKKTLMTPDNINTPYGISQIILRTLKKDHQIFIAELGEYYPGDIVKLTKLVRPQFKILTPVGFAHLERFTTPDRLEKGLLELLTTFPHTPAIVHEANEPLIRKHQLNADHLQYYGENNLHAVMISRAGTEFSTNILGKSLKLFIPLLGIHNACNSLPSLLLCDRFGIDQKTITARLRTLPHIPHRLEPTLLEQNILLLDNGYNSNPGSAAQSLSTLASLDGTQKVVITPGFVELGKEQFTANENLGTKLAKVCDYVGVIQGANQKAILSGLKKTDFDPRKIVVGVDEQEVMELLKSYIKPGAVILFENGIMDVYKQS